MKRVCCSLLLFCCLLSVAQQKPDSSFVPIHLLSLKAGISLNNNSYASEYIRSTYDVHGTIKGKDSIGSFVADTLKYLINPYFNIGIRRQTGRNKGFYFGITYTSSKNLYVSRSQYFLNSFYDGTHYQGDYVVRRGSTTGINQFFRFELLLFKSIRNTNFEIGLVTADYRVTNTKTVFRESVYQAVSNSDLQYIQFDPYEPKFVSKNYVGTTTYEEKKINISRGPHSPLCIGIEQYFDLDKIRLSVGTRVVFSAMAAYLAYQFHTGIHLKYKDKKYRKK